MDSSYSGTSPYLVPVQYYPAPNFVPVYSRPTRSVVDQVVEDDTPEVVRMTTPHYYSLPPPPPYYPYYLPAPLPPKSNVSDDLHYRMRPSLDSVVSRDYSQYGPLAWSWTDFTRHNRNSGEPTNWESLKPHFISGTPVYSGRDSFTPIPDRTVYNKYLTSDYRSTTDTKHKKESTPYFLKSNLPVFGTKNTRKYNELPVSNTEFPFRKYKTDFIPYAPYKGLHDSAKYTPNPDWLSYRPWGYKFRKARYVYVTEDENSSKSIEIERVMREARLRELVKGVYSSSYGEAVNSKTIQYEVQAEKDEMKDINPRSIEAETVVTQKEGERKHLTSAEKRKRNETLAIGLSRVDLLKENGCSATDVTEVKTNICPSRPTTVPDPSNDSKNQDKSNIPEYEISQPQLDEINEKNFSSEKSDAESQSLSLHDKEIEATDNPGPANLSTKAKDNLIESTTEKDFTENFVKQEIDSPINTTLETAVKLKNPNDNEVVTPVNLENPIDKEHEAATKLENPVDIKEEPTVNLENPIDGEVELATNLENPVDKEIEPGTSRQTPLDSDVEIKTNPDNPSDNQEEELTTPRSPVVDKQLDNEESQTENISNEIKEILENTTEITADDEGIEILEAETETVENVTERENKAPNPKDHSTTEKKEDNEIDITDDGKTENGEMKCNTEENRNAEEDGQAVGTSTTCKLGSVSEASNLEYKESFEEQNDEENDEEENEESPSNE